MTGDFSLKKTWRWILLNNHFKTNLFFQFLCGAWGDPSSMDPDQSCSNLKSSLDKPSDKCQRTHTEIVSWQLDHFTFFFPLGGRASWVRCYSWKIPLSFFLLLNPSLTNNCHCQKFILKYQPHKHYKGLY